MSNETEYLLWAEKYRPKTLDEIVNQEEAVSRLKKFVQERNVPHMLFAGPPGTGKTTTALAFAHDLYGETYHQYLLELNASVSKNTPILVRINGRTLRTNFAELDKLYFKDDKEDLSYRDVDDLEVLTVDENYRVKWAKASKIIRHKAPVILRIHLEGGGTLELTGNHSIMVLTENGLKAVEASSLKEGSLILSFVSKTEGNLKALPLEEYTVTKTSRVRQLQELTLTTDNSYTLGLYAAEGAIGFKGKTSGQIIYTIGAHEEFLAEKIHDFAANLGQSVYDNYTSSGFDRSRKSARQIRILSTQLAKLFADSFYDGDKLRAKHKRIPSFIYEMPIYERRAFLKGIADGDGSGNWENVIRISSVSHEMLTDIVWLSRISGIESSIFKEEARLIWKGRMKWQKAELLPAEPIIKILNKISNAVKGNWRYLFRHQLYENKDRISKSKLKKLLQMIDETKIEPETRKTYEILKRLAFTELHALRIKKIELVDYNDYVYDISVPGNEMFFAGSIPILLHNSDERGIDVIRTKIKEFARARVSGDVPFKLILLDEADNMTSDAQQALRRLMENFTSTSRFILIANYPSKIIEPIQSRTALFRFTPLKKEDVISRLAWIADNEDVLYDEKALEVIYEVSEGDMRKAINILQASSALGKVTVDAVYKVVGLAHPKEIREMLNYALKGEFETARNKLRKLMITYGLSGMDIIKQIHREIFSSEMELSDDLRVLIADYTGEIQFRLVEGADDEIQLNAFLAWLSLLGKRLGI